MTQAPPQPSLDLGPSPLLEANPQSLDKIMTERLAIIFNTMPSKYDPADTKMVVEYYRNLRAQFLKAEVVKLAEGPKPKGRKAAVKSVKEALEVATVDNVEF
jgi:hypothetical protein